MTRLLEERRRGASPEARSWLLPARVFLWGALAAGLLSLVVIGSVLVTLSDASRDVDTLVRAADRSTFLIGDVGRQLARLQLTIRRGLAVEAPLVEHQLEDAEDADARIDRALRELEPLLSAAESRVWPDFMSGLTKARGDLLRARDALREGDAALAARHLDLVAASTHKLQDQLDGLAKMNQLESEHLLEGARLRLRRAMEVIIALGGLLLIGGIAIWLYAFRAERARDELEQSLSSLSQDNAELDIFAGRAAHDIRNLLAPVAIAARGLEKASEDPARVRRVAAELRRASERAVQVLEGLLAFARANDGASAASSARVRDEVAGALEDLRPRLSGRDVVVDADVDDAEIACEQRLFRIVLANLLDNAVKFSAMPQRRGHVRVTGRTGHGSYRLEIADDGPGIPSHAIGRLFQPFFRVEGGRAPGTGLGLATVQRIVEAHDGEIHVESTVGQGTSFFISLPLTRAGTPSRPAQRPAAPLRGQ